MINIPRSPSCHLRSLLFPDDGSFCISRTVNIECNVVVELVVVIMFCNTRDQTTPGDDGQKLVNTTGDLFYNSKDENKNVMDISQQVLQNNLAVNT